MPPPSGCVRCRMTTSTCVVARIRRALSFVEEPGAEAFWDVLGSRLEEFTTTHRKVAGSFARGRERVVQLLSQRTRPVYVVLDRFESTTGRLGIEQALLDLVQTMEHLYLIVCTRTVTSPRSARPSSTPSWCVPPTSLGWRTCSVSLRSKGSCSVATRRRRPCATRRLDGPRSSGSSSPVPPPTRCRARLRAQPRFRSLVPEDGLGRVRRARSRRLRHPHVGARRVHAVSPPACAAMPTSTGTSTRCSRPTCCGSTALERTRSTRTRPLCAGRRVQRLRSEAPEQSPRPLAGVGRCPSRPGARRAGARAPRACARLWTRSSSAWRACGTCSRRRGERAVEARRPPARRRGRTQPASCRPAGLLERRGEARDGGGRGHRCAGGAGARSPGGWRHGPVRSVRERTRDVAERYADLAPDVRADLPAVLCELGADAPGPHGHRRRQPRSRTRTGSRPCRSRGSRGARAAVGAALTCTVTGGIKDARAWIDEASCAGIG